MDLPVLHGNKRGQGALVVAIFVALLAALALTTRQGTPLGVPTISRWAGVALMCIGGALTTYSTSIEIPLALSRMHRQGRQMSEVYRGGTYALCRHPGFLWILLYLVGVVLAVDLTSTAIMAAFWFALDLLVIIMQDRVIFPRLFPSYAAYQNTTPFVIPTLSSLRDAFNVRTEVTQ